MTASEPEEPGVLPPGRRRLVFAGMIVAIGSVVMDNVAVALALPSIAAHYGIEPARSIWLVSIHQLALVSFLLPLTALAEKVGYRRVYVAGLVAFAVTATLSALAPDFHFLAASRAAQGVAASAVMSVNMAIIRTIFPERQLGRALGVNATAGAIAIAASPSIAGLLIEYATWQWIFAIGVPTTAGAAVLTWLALPGTPVRAIRYDLGSAALSALTFGGLLSGISRLGQNGGAGAAAGIGIGLLSGVWLVMRLRRVAEPMVPLDLLRIPAFAFSVAAAICAFVAQMLAFVSLPFLMQGAFGLSAVEAGLVFGAWPVALAATAAFAGFLADRLSQGALCATGLGILALGLSLVAALPGTAPASGDLAWRLALCGLGFALFQTPNNRILLGASPRRRAGAASGAIGTTRLLGQALGAALAALILARTGQEGLALWVAAGFALCGASVSVLRYRVPRR